MSDLELGRPTSIGYRNGRMDKMEKELMYSFKSPIPVERLRMQRKIVEAGRLDPSRMAAVLLAHYNEPKPEIRQGVERSLFDLAESRDFLEAVIGFIRCPDRSIRRAAIDFLGSYMGFHAISFLSFYEQTLVLIALGKKKEIPTEDIEALVEVSKFALLEGRVLDAVKDIATCLDLIKHRHKSVEQMKGYLVEVLRIAPELGKMGIFSSKLEEPLRNALRINKQRTYDETREIIRDRYLESCLIDELKKLGKRVRSNIMEPPQMNVSQLQESDVWILSDLQRLMDKVIPRTLVGRTSEAVEILKSFLSEDFNEFYMENMEERLAQGDPSALFTLYSAALSCLKMAAPLLPTQTEDVYQKYYRDLEEQPSVHVVMWPEVMMNLLTSES